MHFESLTQYIAHQRQSPGKGPFALVFVEDRVEVDSTLRHLKNLGFERLLAFLPPVQNIDEDLQPFVSRIDFDIPAGDDYLMAVNTIIPAFPGDWFHYCFNAEYLFYPFCESRNIVEMLTFHTEERREAMLTYVIDLYAADLSAHPNAVSLEDAHLDKVGYYAQARIAPDGTHLERQLDFHGGLRWRYEEHVPENRRKIDRIGLFRAKPELVLRRNHTLSEEEYNTYSCPWHNNLTATIASFRAAKALKRNPGSSHVITNFQWHNSVPFDWHSRQLLDLGLMEPGQWF